MVGPNGPFPYGDCSFANTKTKDNVRLELGAHKGAKKEAWADENIRLVRSQLQLATEAPTSSNLTPPAFVPRRLLDVGSYANDKIRLFLTPQTGSSGGTSITYAALSYCWGPP